MADIFSVVNGAAGNAAAPVAVTTGTVIKTMLQIATPSTKAIKIRQWWCEFDGTTAAAPVKVELMHSTAINATVVAYVAADITKVNTSSTANTSLVTLGTAASGYTASAEGTVSAGVQYEYHLVPPTGGIFIQYPLDSLPIVPVSVFLRIRVTVTPAVNCVCGVQWEE
jgi:hypothetical protein